MSILGPVGTAVYNGQNLNTAETCTTGFSMKPIYDAAQRTITYVETTLTIRFVIYSSVVGTVDADIDRVKSALMRPAGALDWSSKGGGKLQANMPGGAAKDVMYGPMPQSFRIIGTPHQLKTECEWSVLVSLPVCDNAVYQKTPMEINYELNIDIDESGWSKRTYAGHIIIPTTRESVTSTKLLDNADAYLNDLVPSALPGFRRQAQPRKLNYAKTRLDLTVVDTEMATNIPPKSIIDVKARMEYASESNSNMCRYNGTLSADYELAKGTTADVAFTAFKALWADRLAALELALNNLPNQPGAAPNGVGGVPGGKQKSFVWPCGFHASEPDIYGKPHAVFSINFFTVSSFVQLTAGLYRPVPNSNWQQWQASIPSFKSRGSAGLQFQNDQDAIFDLCVTKSTPTSLRSQAGNGIAKLAGQGGLASSKLTANSSWIIFENAIYIEYSDGTIGHRNLLTATLSQGPVLGGAQVPSGLVSNIIQQRNVTSITVIMIGRALRLGFPIAAPILLTVGGVDCVPANRQSQGDGFFGPKIVGNIGVPLFAANWQLRYLLPLTPGIIDAPPNPYLSAVASNSSSGSSLSRGFS